MTGHDVPSKLARTKAGTRHDPRDLVVASRVALEVPPVRASSRDRSWWP